ncbi:Tol-Pal system subunit TolQ [Acetobacter pasteurianus]|uniref:Tol-Pal system protein TolQ n=4 Tax=Acetobacter pasteurianus TaxID=438 RepID=A0A401WX77_ACEPA|nr:protein TolQ [Acetobacter oryzoeni]ASC05705.1 Biopolymer transport protein [Acetobacter pasteurianus subsp. pasteurianus]NLG91230.1 protein TolQ [Acetobacter sp.]OAZ61229.1 Biopolymer transport protein [Acetobacter pasteurianus]CCT59514.1 biopolymer transport protein TolQ [Acetobacter pasteurianus 386B]GBR55414.1 ExbB/TolQ/MotA proton channel family protein [Acetobacter senegalensis DSM 18889]GCD50820.1 biopolymer transport protein TolQ [Acetobacter pasteurianus subsp. pasteurianus LMG 126
MDRAVDAANLGVSAAGDLSVWALFMHASLVVKIVMLGLLICSVMVWAIILDKFVTLRRINREATGFEDRFWSGGSLDDLYESDGAKPTNPMSAVFGAAMGEWRRSARIPGVDLVRGGVKERVDRAIGITITREMDRLRRWVIFLATVAPVAPFVGLFGTVWGIMHSFSSIAAEHNTNLSVVAPGISEALFATAIGLLTAIPAYVAYNVISNSMDLFQDRLEGFGTEFAAILSRQSEERT